MKRSFLVLTISITAVAHIAAAQPSETSTTLIEYAAEARAARSRGDLQRWLEAGTRALRLAPNHVDLLVSAARANAALGRQAAALTLLQQAVDRGAGFDVTQFAELKKLEGVPQFSKIALQAEANLRPVARSTVFATLPEKRFEGIAYDDAGQHFYLGTSDGQILRINRKGQVAPFLSGQGLREILGIKIDPRRRLLWAVSGRFPDSNVSERPADEGTTGVLVFDIDTKQRVTAFELDERPVAHGFNDIALSKDGTAYVTDSLGAAVYVLGPKNMVRLLLQDERMSYPNGIVLGPNEKKLYVAHAEGISAIDTRTGKRTLLSPPPQSNVGGIDGLLWHRGSLIGIQNSPYLDRIVALRLAPDGMRIDRLDIINARVPQYHAQLTATLAEGAMYIVGETPPADLYGRELPAKLPPRVAKLELEKRWTR